MAGHIRSILPQRGGVVPVDNKTEFLAHYDEDINDSLKGYEAIGNQSAISFNGNATKAVETNLSSDDMTAMTIEGWYYFNSVLTTNYYTMASSAEGAGFSFETNNGYPQAAVNIAGSYKVAKSPELHVANKWTHIAASWDGTTLTLYVDGVSKATAACSGSIKPSPYKIFLGCNPPTSAVINGRMSEVKFWNRGLSAAEIKASMNGQLKQGNGLIGYWKFNEGDGIVAFDSSGNGNDGVIYNGTWVEGMSIYSLINGGHPGGSIKAQEGTVNLFKGTVSMSGATAVVEGGWVKLTQTIAGYLGRRHYVDLADLTNGETYTVSATVYNPSDTNLRVGMDWCDSGANYTLGPQETQRIVRTASRSAYDNTYRFADINTDLNRTVWIKDVQIEHKPYATEYVGSPGGKRDDRKEYGKALLIEDGTTNLASGVSYGVYAYCASDGDIPMDNPHGRETVRKFHRTDTTFAARGKKSLPAEQGKTYTMSIMMKVKDGLTRYISPGKPNPEANNSISVTTVSSKAEDFGGGWFKVTEVYTITSNTSTGCIFCFGIADGAVGDEFYVYDLQWEEKAYPTSYVDGARGSHYVVYPESVINKTEGTISFWVNALTIAGLGTNPIITNGSNEGAQAFDILLGDSSAVNGRFYFRRYWNGASGNTQMSYAMPVSVVNRWTFVTGTWKQGQPLKFYIDGQFVGQTPANADMSNYSGNIGVGCTFRQVPNLLVDELRIDRVERTPEEILSWYYQGRNGW